MRGPKRPGGVPWTQIDLLDVGVAQHAGGRQLCQDVGDRHPGIPVDECERCLGGVPHLLETACPLSFCVSRSCLANPADFCLVEWGKDDKGAASTAWSTRGT